MNLFITDEDNINPLRRSRKRTCKQESARREVRPKLAPTQASELAPTQASDPPESSAQAAEPTESSAQAYSADTPEELVLGIDIGIRNLGYCYLRRRASGPPVIERWETVDLSTVAGCYVRNCNRVTGQQLHTLSELGFPKLFEDLRPDVVRIEAQPGKRSMLVLSHLALAYFRRDRHCTTMAGLVHGGVKYPAAWLRAAGAPVRKRPYPKRKQLSVKLAKHFVSTGAVAWPSEPVAGADAADALLLALSYKATGTEP